MDTMILSIIIYLFSFLNNSEGIVATPIKSNYLRHTQEKELEYKALYDSTISFIKYHEGFRADWYDDNGYPAIGYGQRKAFFRGTIIAPISKEQAHNILIQSFNNHIRIARYYYPRLSKKKQLAIAHMSFCIGIGRVKQLALIEGTELNAHRLLTLPHPQNRQFEINLFNL